MQAPGEGGDLCVRSQAFMQSLSYQLARLCFDQAAARSKVVTIIMHKRLAPLLHQHTHSNSSK
jgi:hypothetical protein